MTGHTLGQGKAEDAQNDGYVFTFSGAVLGLIACLIILIIKRPVIGLHNITEETRSIADQLMNAIALILIFQSINSILTKGVLRGGGDTKFLMAGDVLFLWFVCLVL